MPALSNQFKTGNYNSWSNLINEVLPNTNNTIRNTIIPCIDTILDSMLGSNSNWTKKSIDVSQKFENNYITGLNCSIVYEVEDFNVPGAPNEAITTDCDAIKEALSGKSNFDTKEVNINTSNGELSLEFEVLFEDNDD